MVVIGTSVACPEISNTVLDGEMESVVPDITTEEPPGTNVVAAGEPGSPIITAPGRDGSVNTGRFPILVIGFGTVPPSFGSFGPVFPGFERLGGFVGIWIVLVKSVVRVTSIALVA